MYCSKHFISNLKFPARIKVLLRSLTGFALGTPELTTLVKKTNWSLTDCSSFSGGNHLGPKGEGLSQLGSAHGSLG